MLINECGKPGWVSNLAKPNRSIALEEGEKKVLWIAELLPTS